MTVQHLQSRRAPSFPALPAYFIAEDLPPPAPLLRPLTALEQMYAYWGSDRG